MLILLAVVALLASFLTFFSGFGLGTLLSPAFALFFPVQIAIACTAIVHLANNLFKLLLVFRHVRWNLFVLFAIPAAIAASLGAWILLSLGTLPTLLSYSFWGIYFIVTPIKLIIGSLFILFAYLELTNKLKNMQFATKYLPLGGIISGFFGGLSGNQGAFRSAFLMKFNLDKQAFIATGVISACIIDIFRSAIYFSTINFKQLSQYDSLEFAIYIAICSAFGGALIGKSLLTKITMKGIQLTVSIMMMSIGFALMTGLL
ncbi:sulfite exporter TauE/SafE family protein [Aliikangiella maris]|uniref:Sulfite exporter TauE/SafE family protein n=2 Tax=Aliikangiella maris TaxID=3162458 RepID=A0ABV3MUC7_9GAMM